jgi:hypothetical protein
LIEVTPPKSLGLPTVEVHLTDNQFVRYTHWLTEGGQIQDLLPDLSPSDREALLNGTR